MLQSVCDEDDDGSLVNGPTGDACCCCFVMGNDLRELCKRLSDGDVAGIGVQWATNGNDLDDEQDDEDATVMSWCPRLPLSQPPPPLPTPLPPPTGLTRARWSCGEPLMWMCVSA